MVAESSIRQRRAGATCPGDILLHEDLKKSVHEFCFSHIFFDDTGKRKDRGVVLREEGSSAKHANFTFVKHTGHIFVDTDLLEVKYESNVCPKEGIMNHPLLEAQRSRTMFTFSPFGHGGVSDLQEWKNRKWENNEMMEKWLRAENKDMEVLFDCMKGTEDAKRGVTFCVEIQNWDMRAWKRSNFLRDYHWQPSAKIDKACRVRERTEMCR